MQRRLGPGSIALAAGETVTCVFTNAKRGRIVVDKVTVPANDPQSFAFALTGGGRDQPGLLAHARGDAPRLGLLAGHVLGRRDRARGLSLTGATCSDGSAPGAIDLGAGETVTCTFTNTKQARIVVQKQTDPDGSAQSFSFSASYDADGFSLSDGQSNDSGDLARAPTRSPRTCPRDGA